MIVATGGAHGVTRPTNHLKQAPAREDARLTS